MRIETDIGITESLTIYDAKMPPGKGSLDPINVILRDFGGQGQIIVECYGTAWAHWFGGIGLNTLRGFISRCDEHHLSDKLAHCTTRRPAKHEREYLKHIARAVIDAMKNQPLQLSP